MSRQASAGRTLRITGPRDFARAFPVSDATLARLEAYADTLRLWQRRINLVAPSTVGDVWHRHLADSAQLVPLAPEGFRTWVDLGSGAGFPGLVVAILLAGEPQPGRRLTLVESDQRKAAFMAEVLRVTGIGAIVPVDILVARIETAATRAKLSSMDVVSARALAPLDRLLGLASPLLAPAGCGLFLKGRGVEVELDAARQSWQFTFDEIPSLTDAEARVIRVHGPAVAKEGRNA